eukprot:Skav233372  [mRNA]  locus=scaffold1038:22017:42926:+ [translate_table: standard]
MPMITSGESASAGHSVLKKLIDKTAEFVADEGWEFDAWPALSPRDDLGIDGKIEAGLDGESYDCEVEEPRRFRATCQAAAIWAAEVLPLLSAKCAGSVYVCGGYCGPSKLRSAERFDILEGSWEKLPTMLEVHSGPAAASFQGDFYVFGTNSDAGKATAERFVPSFGQWEALPLMLQGRERPASASVGGSLYVCGGLRKAPAGSVLTHHVEHRNDQCQYICGGDGALVDTAIGAFEAMRQQRFAPAAAAVSGKLYVCGGADAALLQYA